MRLKELQLLKYGSFDGQVLRFQSKLPGLHIVFGHNEAGKSTALRALKALLFGIAPKTRDNFRYGNDVLSVGALLQTSDGREFEVQRFKKTPSLRDKQGKPLDSSIIGECLEGIDEGDFQRFFGIDYDELRDGSAMLLAEKGDLGASIFSAGLGALDLGAVLANLDSEAGELFKPRASTKTINAKIKEYNEKMRAAKDAALKPKDFCDKEDELEAANEALNALRQTENELRATQTKLERIARTRRNALKLLELERQLAELGTVTLLPDGFIDERRRTTDGLRRFGEETERRTREINRCDDDLAKLQTPAAILDEADAITSLQHDLTSYNLARKDHPPLIALAEQLKRDAGNILKRLRPNAALSDAESLRPRDDQARRIHELSKLEAALRSKHETFAADVSALENQLLSEKEKLAALPEPRPTDRLHAVMKSVQKKGDIENALTAETVSLASQRTSAEKLLKRLPLWQGTLEELAELKTPAAESLDDFEKTIQSIQSKQESLTTQIEGQNTLIKSCQSELDRLREERGALPTAAQLQLTRERRERGWALVRRSWLQREDVTPELSDYAPGIPLEAAYEKSVQDADGTADHRYREASRVEIQEDRLRQITAAERERKALNLRLEACGVELAAAQDRWRALWHSLHIVPESPAAMRSWLTRQQQVLLKYDALSEGEHKCAALNSTLSEARRDVCATLSEAGETGVEITDPLHELLDHAERFCKTQDDRARGRIKRAEAIERITGEWKNKIIDRDRAKTKWAEWQEQWSDAVSALQLRPDALVGEALETLTKLDELFKKLDQLPDLENRLKLMALAIEHFESRITTLGGRIDPALNHLTPNQAAAALHTRLSAAQSNQASASLLARQRRDAARQNSLAAEEAAALEKRMTELCAAAQCVSAADLDLIERRFETWSNLNRELKSAREILLDAGDGLTRDELLAESESIDADTLAARLGQTKSDLIALEPQRRTAHDTFSRIKLERDKMDGGAQSAEAVEQAQLILAQIRDAVEEYVRLRTAAAILKKEIERFQDANQTPLLKHASKFFATLTRGAFSGVRGVLNDDDENELMGVRDDQSPVSVVSMSDGTRDQLYLALRLAHLQWHLDRESTESPPFVIDDVLVNFDDVRSEAAFKVLHELATRIQIIVFTHHRHIVDIARSANPTATCLTDKNQTLEVYSFEGKTGSETRSSA